MTNSFSDSDASSSLLRLRFRLVRFERLGGIVGGASTLTSPSLSDSSARLMLVSASVTSEGSSTAFSESCVCRVGVAVSFVGGSSSLACSGLACDFDSSTGSSVLNPFVEISCRAPCAFVMPFSLLVGFDCAVDSFYYTNPGAERMFFDSSPPPNGVYN